MIVCIAISLLFLNQMSSRFFLLLLLLVLFDILLTFVVIMSTLFQFSFYYYNVVNLNTVVLTVKFRLFSNIGKCLLLLNQMKLFQKLQCLVELFIILVFPDSHLWTNNICLQYEHNTIAFRWVDYWNYYYYYFPLVDGWSFFHKNSCYLLLLVLCSLS